MPRNGSGTASILNTFTAGTTIAASQTNANNADIASMLTASLAIDGQSSMTGALKGASGTVSLPGIAFGADPNTGLYRIGADNAGFACNGAKVLDIGTAGLGVTGTLAASGAITQNSAPVAPTGVVYEYYLSTLPTGWLWVNGETIGNASSGGTARANADTEALFVGLHIACANDELPIQDSDGDPSTRATGGTAQENAAADYAANKRLPLPNRCDRAAIGKADMGGATDVAIIADDDTTLLGKTLGAEKVDLVADNIPEMTTNTTGAHTHDDNLGVITDSRGLGSATTAIGNQTGQTGSAGNHSHTVGNPMPDGVNKMPPAIVCNFIIKL